MRLGTLEVDILNRSQKQSLVEGLVIDRYPAKSAIFRCGNVQVLRT